MRQLTVRQELHRQFISSPRWAEIRKQALEHYGCVCSRCHRHGTDVHHKTYRRFGGMELMSDLEVMCRECHTAHHAAEKSARVCKRRMPTRRAMFKALTRQHIDMIKQRFRMSTDGEIYVALCCNKPSNKLFTMVRKLLGK